LIFLIKARSFVIPIILVVLEPYMYFSIEILKLLLLGRNSRFSGKRVFIDLGSGILGKDFLRLEIFYPPFEVLYDSKYRYY
jgi:hypothetical protein